MDFIINQPNEYIGNNTIIDNGAEFTNSTILFRGENNLLFIEKGINVGSGSILAAESLITKSVPSNVTFGGSPAKVIKKDIFWLRPSVHNFVDKDTEKMKKYEESTYIYNNNDIDLFSKIENALNSIEESSQKLNFLLNLNKDKNRFYLK